MMNLAVLHYHLNRGGVTRVIENHLAALDAVLDPAEPWNVAVIYGGRCEAWNHDVADRLKAIRLTLVEAPLLDYDDVQPSGKQLSAADLLMELYMALGRVEFDPQQTVLHIHNHSLGKNRQLPEVVPILAQDGYGVLLHPHDFAEDFRPGNYRHLGNTSELYPQAPAIHYATLNGRDHRILQTVGVAPERLHMLPNPVPAMDNAAPRAGARKKLRAKFDVAEDDCYVLYPIRCIRRKNIGEALLLSVLAPQGTIVGLTLAPINPEELPGYTKWKDFAAEFRLPCRFGVGEPGGLGFFENLAASDLILTTSLAEGFGMVFLESWLAGRPLIGRDLPEVTHDFARAGVRFDWLSPQLLVPVDWVGADRFRDAVAAAYRKTLDAYNRPEPPDMAEGIDAKIQGGLVDFGDLDESMQRTVIEAVCRDAENRQQVLDANPQLSEAFAVRPDTASDVIRHNAEAIRQHFSLEPSGQRLLNIYTQVAASDRDETPQPLPGTDKVLDQFLRLDRFRLIRT